MPKDQTTEHLELNDGEVRGEGSLHAFLANDTNTDIGLKDHAYIVAAVTNRASSLSSELANLGRNDSFLGGTATAHTD